MTPAVHSGSEKIVARGFVLRFLLLLASVLALGALLLFLAFFAAFSRPLPRTYASAFFALRHLSSALLPIVLLAVFVYAILVSGAAAALCLLAMHKVAGPLFRTDRAAEAFLSGAPVPPLFFRRGDQAAAVGEAFNAFVVSLRGDRKEILAAMDHADRLCLQDAAACRAEREKALERIASILFRYR